MPRIRCQCAACITLEDEEAVWIEPEEPAMPRTRPPLANPNAELLAQFVQSVVLYDDAMRRFESENAEAENDVRFYGAKVEAMQADIVRRLDTLDRVQARRTRPLRASMPAETRQTASLRVSGGAVPGVRTRLQDLPRPEAPVQVPEDEEV